MPDRLIDLLKDLCLFWLLVCEATWTSDVYKCIKHELQTSFLLQHEVETTQNVHNTRFWINKVIISIFNFSIYGLSHFSVNLRDLGRHLYITMLCFSHFVILFLNVSSTSLSLI